jgi:hypothetical protein
VLKQGRSDRVTIMTISRIRVVSDSDLNEVHYTDLFASIAEEDGGYTVQVRLSNKASPQNAAWGEEIADSIEASSCDCRRVFDPASAYPD